jgi:AAT family amino acid transporter/D-serine/D-alanine/glycine transporter
MSAEPPNLDRETAGEGVSMARALTSRHVQFIAIGGAIGAGLFLGSGQAIAAAGPGVLVAYALAGVAVFLMARALGELTLNRPPAASIANHVDDFVGPWAGFMTGWSYWMIWVLVGVAEITAVGVFVRYWAPAVPQWLPALIALAAVYGINRLGVRVFGELEFGLTLIKVAAIAALILCGVVMIVLHLGPPGQHADIAHLWSLGGFLPHGLSGLLSVVPVALFAFGGTEMVGVTAAETVDPQRALPRAINGVILRILLFYVGALAVVMAVAPWTAFSADKSPFVMVFDRAGLPGAASLINFVVLTAVVSSCNSGVYATGRVLSALAQRGQAPRALGRLDGRRLPIPAITASVVAMLVGVGLNYLFPEKVFGYVMSLVAALLLWTWAMIILAHLGFRRTLRRGGGAKTLFAMPLYPAANILVLGFILVVAMLMWRDPQSRAVFYAAVVWFAASGAAFFASRKAASARVAR